MIDARENVNNFIFLHHYMLFVNIVSVNLPTQIVKEPYNSCLSVNNLNNFHMVNITLVPLDVLDEEPTRLRNIFQQIKELT